MRPTGFRWENVLPLLVLVVNLLGTSVVIAVQPEQRLGRLMLQTNETDGGRPACEPEVPADSGSGSGTKNNCRVAGDDTLEVAQISKPVPKPDDGKAETTVIFVSAAAVIAVISSATLLFGYFYRKDPEWFRRKYRKLFGVSPQNGQPLVPPALASGPLPMHLQGSGHNMLTPVSIAQGSALAQSQGFSPSGQHPSPGNERLPYDPDISVHSGHSAVPGLAPSPQGAVQMSNGFVLPANVVQVPGPRIVPAPGLSLEDASQHSSASSRAPNYCPQVLQPPCPVDSFQFPAANSQQSSLSDRQHQPISSRPQGQMNVAAVPVGGSRPPRSPFFPPGDSQSSQLDSERQSPMLAQSSGPATSTVVLSEYSADHVSRNTTAEKEFPKLKYDIRVFPLSERSTPLGKGAFGTVEAGVFKDSNGKFVRVAVKYGTELFPTMAPREVLSIFQSELDVLSKVPTHANIVRCYGGRVRFGEEEQFGARDVYIVEELMHTNLQDVIHGDDFSGGLPYKLILNVALHIATGLEHLHQSGVLHYDLKPANILVDEDFNAKIADFGASKVKYKTYITGTGMRGTPGYMAPELMLVHFVQNLLISDKIDIYSFGVMLWEMVERDHPPNIMSLGNQSNERGPTPVVQEHRFPLSRRCPEGLRRLIQHCVSLNPGERPSAGEIRESVEDMILQCQNRTSPLPSVDG